MVISSLFSLALITLFIGLSKSLVIILILRFIGGFMACVQDFANKLMHSYTVTSASSNRKALKYGSLAYVGGFVLAVVTGA